MVQQRPVGVTIIALLAILSGLIGLCWAVSLSGFAGVAWLTGTLFGGDGLQSWGNSTLWGAITGALSAVFSLVFGIGAWNLRPWAWWVGVIAMVIGLISPILALINGDIVPGVFGLIIPAAVLIYLLIPGTRQAFLNFERTPGQA
jgi:hypothetical protein